MPGITDTEGRSQFSLWCILGAPLFLGTDVRNMTAATAATVGNLEAIAINQGASVQAWQIPLGGGGAAPTPDNGGLLMNLTDCASGNAGLTWSFDAASGQLQSVESDGQCVTVVACDTTNSSEVFAYQCVTNQCSNEIWKVSGSTIVSQVDGAAQPLCLTGVDPATAPRSQLIADVCDGRAAQQWTLDAASKQVRLAAFPAASQCLTLFAAPPVSAYMKPMDNGDVALALLNRGAADVAPVSVDLAQFGYAPATPVWVRDVWAATTAGPFTGSFATRGVASHETLLLRLSLAKPGEAEL